MAHLTFDELEHKYFLDGEEIPSVTQVMKAAGIIDDRFYNEEGRQRGTAVHVACQYLDEGDLDWDSLDETIVPYVKAYEKFKAESGFIPYMIEQKIYSADEGLEYAGTLDRTGCFRNIGLSPMTEILDIKTGQLPKWAGIQLAGYALGLRKGNHDIRRFGLQLRESGTFRLIEYKQASDFDVFLAALKIYHNSKIVEGWKVAYGR